MESISTKKLPPIFKLSLLSKILPYFGYLHDWKWILESINKKTNDIWDQNKEELKYWGRDLKRSLHLDDSLIKLSENIMLNAELFKFLTKRFVQFLWETEKTQEDKIEELKRDILILKLCNQLNEDNAIVFQKWISKCLIKDEIFFQTRKEIAEMIPSPKCTSSILEIKMFEDNQAQDLWKYIADSIKLKRLIVKKNENNTFEVYSITSHHFLDWNKYNILSEEVRERLVTYYSCPVSNCICKPKTLLLSSYNLYDMSEEQIDEIWELSLLENTHRLKVYGNVKTLSKICYLSRIKQKFPKLEIHFDYFSWRDGILWNYLIYINSKLITLVANGEEWIFHISGDDKWSVYKILDLKFNEKENIAIINWGEISLWNVLLETNSKSEIKDQTLIYNLKEKTRLKNDKYIIVDTGTLELQTNAFKIKKCIAFAKHFKCINIRINETESEFKEEIEEINKLPKQWSIWIKIDNIHKFINSDALNLIDQDFNRIIVESKEIKFKRIKSNSRSRERMFTVFESLFYKTKTADIRELREMISKKYEK